MSFLTKSIADFGFKFRLRFGQYFYLSENSNSPNKNDFKTNAKRT